MSLGLLSGYFVGKWDSRKSDLLIYNEMTIGITAWGLNEVAKSQDQDLPPDSEIIQQRDEWFAEPISRIRIEGSRSGKLALVLVALSVSIFTIAQAIN
jgi:hypothetical protein